MIMEFHTKKHGCVVIVNSHDEVSSKLHVSLNDSDTKIKLAKGREKFIEEVLSFRGNSCSKIHEIISSMIKK